MLWLNLGSVKSMCYLRYLPLFITVATHGDKNRKQTVVLRGDEHAYRRKVTGEDGQENICRKFDAKTLYR